MNEGVRLVQGSDHRPVQRTDPQKAQDEILNQALEAAETALEAAETAISWLSVVHPPRSRNVVVYVQQLIEEINETRRIRQ